MTQTARTPLPYLKPRRVLHMLSIKQLNKTYDNGVKAINNVSLEIPNGMFGLLGPNGAGKSSLMRTIATLQDPDSGSITFNGVDVLKDKEGLRRYRGLARSQWCASA